MCTLAVGVPNQFCPKFMNGYSSTISPTIPPPSWCHAFEALPQSVLGTEVGRQVFRVMQKQAANQRTHRKGGKNTHERTHQG